MYYLTPLSAFSDAEQNPVEENAAIPADDIVLEEFVDEEPEEEPGGEIVPSGDDRVTTEDMTADRWMIPASLATQVFSIVPGIAGGLAGFVLASKLSNAKSVKASEVLLASGSVALITFMSVFLVRTIEEIKK